jgi:pyridoxamine 5'-phosphate oxidase
MHDPQVRTASRKIRKNDPANENDPLTLIDAWLAEARLSEPNDPNAAALATADATGAPSVRMVLVKPVRDKSLCFFTNAESQKGRELTENPRAALCFHWKSLRRQVRVEGSITELAPAAVDAYFRSRSRESQIGAAVSDQSRPLPSREVLVERARLFAEANPGPVPRPNYWRGYQLHPARIEFWIDGPHRLHDRFLFTRVEDGWQKSRLYP